MKKKIITVILVALLAVGGSVTAFAAPQLGYTAAFDSESGLVTVTIFISDPVGVQSGNLWLAFDNEMYEYRSSTTADNGAMVDAGIAIDDSSLCTCAFIYTDACEKGDLDSEGNLILAEYIFKPLTDTYDMEDFYFWTTSIEHNNADIAASFNTQGNEEHASDHTSVVVQVEQPNNAGNQAQNGANNDGASSAGGSASGSNWYMYVIFGVVAVGAIGGIAFISVKNNRKHAEDSEGENDENTSEDESHSED